MTKEELDLVKSCLNHEGDFQESFVQDKKATWHIACLFEQFLKGVPQNESLPPNQIQNVVQLMFRAHPVVRMQFWAAAQTIHVRTLFDIHPHVEDLMIYTAGIEPNMRNPHPTWKLYRCENEKDLLDQYLHTPKTEVQSWLRANGFVD
jgi:hypothetical protein